jgi:sugar/nucleoside kinase (ribokinase family)
MPRPRTIIGIGEALLCEFPDRAEPGGLAVQVALAAKSLGDNGLAISRIGQDRAGDELLGQLTRAGLNTTHVQSDPDQPTGRLVVRSIAGKSSTTLTSKAAFDNLQWDFDLVDVAQQAEGVVFGNLARRDGQSRSVIKQFLAECTGALRVFDLSNRGDAPIDRADVRSALEYTDALVADAAALRVLAPSWTSPQIREGALEVCAANRLSFVATVEKAAGGESFAIHSGEGSWSAPKPVPPSQHEAMVVRIVHGMLNGADLAGVLQ